MTIVTDGLKKFKYDNPWHAPELFSVKKSESVLKNNMWRFNTCFLVNIENGVPISATWA